MHSRSPNKNPLQNPSDGMTADGDPIVLVGHCAAIIVYTVMRVSHRAYV
jgi:hypothetical protein